MAIRKAQEGTNKRTAYGKTCKWKVPSRKALRWSKAEHVWGTEWIQFDITVGSEMRLERIVDYLLSAMDTPERI